MDRRIILGIVAGCLLLVGVGVWLGSKNSRSSEFANEGETTEELKITDNDWIKGDKKAQITLIEYGDFQCPACGAYYPLLKQLLEEFGGKLRIVYRHFPLTRLHDKAWAAAAAAEAAGVQGKFWEMHDKLFEHQGEWSKDKDIEKFKKYAADIGLDSEKFAKDLDNGEVQRKIFADQGSGNRLEVTGTPTFFVNGVKIELPGSYENFKKVIEGEAAKITPEKKVHEHMDIKIVIDGAIVDLGQDKYQEKDPDFHFHDNNGEVVHKHKDRVTMGQLVKSLGLGGKEPVILYVDGREIEDWQAYQPQDLDRLFLSMGVVSNVQLLRLPKTVTDKACIYSEKCPERGKPPAEEGCVGGLGTPCD